MNIDLLPYQSRAADQIVRRFIALRDDPERPWETQHWKTPFYQALSAITGSGKTAILADAVAQMRPQMDGEPIVLWISKAKAVVEQTFANLSAGASMGISLRASSSSSWPGLTPSASGTAARASSPRRPSAPSTGTKRGEEGALKVHKVQRDKGDTPLWTALRERRTVDEKRRPLVIVYDEAQNLADQQVEILFEPSPTPCWWPPRR